MSFKCRLRHQYQNFIFALKTIAFPAWFNHYSVKGSLFGVICIFGFLYLLQTNHTAASGYEINKLERQVDELTHLIQKMEITVAEEGSMARISERLTAVNMVPVEKINFVTVMNDAVALR